jgi:hypothetical protein
MYIRKDKKLVGMEGNERYFPFINANVFKPMLGSH